MQVSKRLASRGLKVLCSLRKFSTKDRGAFEEAIVGSNPMFPQRPMKVPPPPSDGDDDKNDSKNKANDEHWLSRHGGKIGWFALVATISMITSYYKSYRAKVDQQESMVALQAIEPHEINEVRYSTQGMSHDAFLSIIDSAYAAFGSSSNTSLDDTSDRSNQPMITYPEFMEFLKPELARRGVCVGGGHILDRIVEVLVARVPSMPTDTKVDFSSTQLTVTTAEKRFPLSLMLTLLSVSVQDTAVERVNALFDCVSEVRPSHSPETASNEREDAVSINDGPRLLSVPFPNYIPSETFSGRKDKYVFKNGANGVGYYADVYGVKLANDAAVKEYEESAKASGAVNDTGNDSDVLPVEAAETILQHLIDTCQVPPEKQVITTGVKYPIEIFRPKLPNDMIRIWKRDFRAKPAVLDAADNTVQREKYLTRAEVRDLVLGPEVCAWGECWRRRGA
jgi:hypothetical protein